MVCCRLLLRYNFELWSIRILVGPHTLYREGPPQHRLNDWTRGIIWTTRQLIMVPALQSSYYFNSFPMSQSLILLVKWSLPLWRPSLLLCLLIMLLCVPSREKNLVGLCPEKSNTNSTRLCPFEYLGTSSRGDGLCSQCVGTGNAPVFFCLPHVAHREEHASFKGNLATSTTYKNKEVLQGHSTKTQWWSSHLSHHYFLRAYF